jgi:hypothetical protein
MSFRGRAGHGSAGSGMALLGAARRCKAGQGMGRVDGLRRGSTPRHPRTAGRCWARLRRARHGTAWRGGAWLGGLRHGLAGDLAGDWQALGFEPSAPTHGWARHGYAGRCRAGFGEVRLGQARDRGGGHTSGFESRTPTHGARLGLAVHGNAGLAPAWLGKARRAVARRGRDSIGRSAETGVRLSGAHSWRGRTGLCKAGSGLPGQCLARTGRARRGDERRGWARELAGGLAVNGVRDLGGVRPGEACRGEARLGPAGLGEARERSVHNVHDQR